MATSNKAETPNAPDASGISLDAGNRDVRLLFIARFARMFAYGFLAVVLALFLAERGFSESQIGLLVSLTLLGDTLISLWLTVRADRIGRKRTLQIGAVLMIFAGAAFPSTDQFVLLLVIATVGVISPSGHEVGPFLAIEQASLAQVLASPSRTRIFGWYHLTGSVATALGSLAGGTLAAGLQYLGYSPLTSFQAILLGYGAIGLILFALFSRISAGVEARAEGSTPLTTSEERKPLLGLHRSRNVVVKLCGLFALDAFAGGFVIQSILAYWLHLRFGVQPALLGAILFAANLLSALSALVASWLAGRIGLVRTMVFTHLPANIFLMAVPLMPNLPLAILMLLLRASISQMDVPARQSYTMGVVEPDERSAAAGLTGVARSIGTSLSPSLAGLLISSPALLGVPFFLGGGLKIVYDLLLYRGFASLRTSEEREATHPR